MIQQKFVIKDVSLLQELENISPSLMIFDEVKEHGIIKVLLTFFQNE